MKMTSTRSLLLALLPALSVKAFTTHSPASAISSSSSKTRLNVGAAWNLGDGNSEQDYDSFVSFSETMMHRAEQCASHSEECSLEEAQICLDEVLHIQSNCVGAGVLSTSTEVCGVDTFDTLPFVVDSLRTKIRSEQQRLVFLRGGLHVLNVALGVTVVAMILHGLVQDPNVPVVSGTGEAAVLPFLPMEVVWSIRDGYFPLLMKEWMQHGGLQVVDTSVFEAKSVPISGQEWMWALQNGFLSDLSKEYMVNGGLRVDASYSEGGAVGPLQAEEWLYALRDGYLPQAVQHVFRNGGL
ncbi:MAG: hypothetical protein SGILL_004431 [Bacillariaceae sp.]